MAKKLVKLGVKREKNHLYYIGKDGNVWAAPMARAGKKGGKAKKVADAGVKKEEGFLYFLDKNGDVAMASISRGSEREKSARKMVSRKTKNNQSGMKTNVLVCGKTGVGKTSIIQSICGKKIVPSKKISHGSIGTKSFCKYKFDQFVFWDSAGFEPGEDMQKYTDRILNFVCSRPKNDPIHILWYCIRGSGARVVDFDKVFVKNFPIPVFIVLTQDDVTKKKQRESMKMEFNKKRFSKFANKVFITSSEEKTGIDKLLKQTIKCLPEGINIVKRIQRKIRELEKQKIKKANAIIRWATYRAAGIAAVPFPAADVSPLVANESYMILKIGNIYGIPVSKSMIGSFLGILGASAIGKTIASFFPGIKIGIAAATTYGVGKTVKYWFEQDMKAGPDELKTIYTKTKRSYYCPNVELEKA